MVRLYHNNLSLARTAFGATMPHMGTNHNIYIHVPFCASKCNYCAFYSLALKPNWDKYAADICSELDYWGRTLGPVEIPTIFFGGGTPSLMPPHIFAKIITKISATFHIAPDCEVTIEANPGTLGANALAEFIAIGVNRLSIGVQSLDDEKLHFLGRRHTAKDAINLINIAGQHNIRLSADFIYGMPGDTPDQIIKLCNNINTLGLTHCSMYELTIEPNTPFGKAALNMPSNTEMADMYTAIQTKLALPRYEVSNYAMSGNECRHNANIWDGAPYIGIGHGAAGRILINNQWYDQAGAGACFLPLAPEARATEKIITGMRTMRGVKITPDVHNIINWHWVATHPDLLQRTGDRLHATDTGILTLDHMLIELIR